MASTEQSGGVRIPLLGTRIERPGRGSLAWYAGLGAMTALEVIEWPVALLVAAGHALSTHAHNPELHELGEGVESGG